MACFLTLAWYHFLPKFFRAEDDLNMMSDEWNTMRGYPRYASADR